MKVLVIAVVVAAVAAAPDSPPSYGPPPSYGKAPVYKDEPIPYKFDYAVNDKYTGTQFAQNEESDGHNAKGSYSVALPDGRLQTVNYVADHYNGYNADVSYQGEAKHPEYHPAPAYKPAPVPYKPAPKY